MTRFKTPNLYQEKITMRTVAKSLAVACGVMLAGTALHAQTNVVSDPVGFYKVSIAPGANFISAPMQPIQAFRGLVSGVAGNVVTLTGAAFTANQFATAANGFTQYILIVKNDADKAVGAANNITGDWAQIASNGTNSVTVSAAQGLAPLLGVGDQVEVRRLTTLKDLFGDASTLILNKDTTGNQSPAESDVIRYVAGTSFTKTVSYYDDGAGTFGYFLDTDGSITDGSTLTIEPDEPLLLFRKTGTTNMVSLGQVQTTRLTHYMQSGPNTVASVFPANAPLGTSNLDASGWLKDLTGNQSPAETDVIRVVAGTSFGNPITLLDSTISTSGLPTWFDSNTEDNAIPLIPGKGYVFFVKGGTGGRTWRQNVPFTP